MGSVPMGVSGVQKVFLVVWLLGSSPLFPCDATLLCGQSLDTCTRDLTSDGQLNDSYAGMILTLRSHYEDMPLMCQIDHGLCKNQTTRSYAKGDIVWPLTEVGTRRASRCPYAYTADQYVDMDCIVNEKDAAIWTYLNDTSCPLPPFSREVEALDVSLVNTTVLERDQCLAVIESIDNLVRIRYENLLHPVLHEDRNRLVRVCSLWVKDCYLNYDLQQMTVNIWNVSDMLLNETAWNTWNTVNYESFLLHLEYLFPRYSSAPIQSQNLLYRGDVLEATCWNRQDGKLEYDFLETNDNGISASVTIDSNRTLYNVRMFLVKNVYNMGEVTVDRTNEYLENTDNHDVNETSSAEIPLKFHIPNRLVVDPSRSIVGSIVFLKFDESKGADEKTRIVFRHPELAKNTTSELICANAIRPPETLESSYTEAKQDSNNVRLTRWSTEKCRLVSLDGDTVTCLCAGAQGFFAVLGPFQFVMLAPPIMPPDDKTDISVFMGFPYIEELSIAGKVLRAISLVCLVITILSYSIFSKTRKGTPTRILLNLCVSLIVLLIVLYVAEYQASSRMGCRVLNVFRYYLVLVSLLWNAVEAHNMYKMLIKVFDAETSHFVLIAGIFAWGVPALFVAIGLAVDLKAFDGTYVNCKFRCSLRHNTLIYGWILPMSVIIAHNLIVFSMVLYKVLLKRDPASPGLKGSAKSHKVMSRLIGAVTMLVLLGVPWVFSAFGVIDTGNSGVVLKYLEGIFNVVFIVCISLQGLFIFAFHCARIKDIRQQWKSAVKSRSSTFSSTIPDSTNSTRTNDIGRGASHGLKNNAVL